MDEYGIRELIGEVTRGRLSRRQFVETLVIRRHAVFATGSSIRGFDFSPFSGPLWRIVYWTKEA